MKKSDCNFFVTVSGVIEGFMLLCFYLMGHDIMVNLHPAEGMAGPSSLHSGTALSLFMAMVMLAPV